jgi:uncharacterized membrane-anchored protein YhcB (DUF1043 family)
VNFAQISPTELTTIIALFIGMLTGFYALVRFMLIQQDKVQCAAAKVQELDREERIKLTSAFTRVAEATEQAAREAKERNGHLAELELTSQEMFQKLADRNYAAITNIKEQHVTNQVVEHEQVCEKQ